MFCFLYTILSKWYLYTRNYVCSLRTHKYTLFSVKLCYCYYKMLFICLLLLKCNQWQYMDFVLYCIGLYCIVLDCITLYCIVLYCFKLYCIGLFYIVLYCIVLYCIVLNCIALHCFILDYIVLCCIILYCIVISFRASSDTDVPTVI